MRISDWSSDVCSSDLKAPMERLTEVTHAIQGEDEKAPWAAQLFGGGGRDYQERYGAKDETFAKISVKARRHAANNPLAIFRDPISLEEVMASPKLYGPLTRLQACPPTCGAAAAVLVSPTFAAKHGLDARVEIVAQAMTTDTETSFERSMMKVIGYDMAKEAARQVYEAAGIGRSEEDTSELQ